MFQSNKKDKISLVTQQYPLVCLMIKYPWRSGCFDLNKGECDLNQSKDDSFVKRVAKNNN